MFSWQLLIDYVKLNAEFLLFFLFFKQILLKKLLFFSLTIMMFFSKFWHVFNFILKPFLFKFPLDELLVYKIRIKCDHYFFSVQVGILLNFGIFLFYLAKEQFILWSSYLNKFFSSGTCFICFKFMLLTSFILLVYKKFNRKINSNFIVVRAYAYIVYFFKITKK